MCDFNPTPVSLSLKDPNCDKAIPLPCGHDERSQLDNVPEELCVNKEFEHGNWKTTVSVERGQLQEVYKFIYSDALPDGLAGLEGNSKDILLLTGYWD